MSSIATSRRRRNAKTDRLDSETLLRTLLAFKRGEPRVCAMVRPPTPEEEDRRRNSRERTALIGERVKLVNRIKGLLFSQGITDFAPLKRDRRRRLEDLRTGEPRADLVRGPHDDIRLERLFGGDVHPRDGLGGRSNRNARGLLQRRVQQGASRRRGASPAQHPIGPWAA